MRKIIIINMLLVFFFLFIAEFLSRILNLADFTGLNKDLIIKNFDSFNNRKNIETKVFGKIVYIDTYGWRVPSKDYLYKKNNLNFLILGDSTSFGVGVKEEETFVGRLRTDFPHINFFNTSVVGYNLLNYNKVLQQTIDNNYKIKHIILFLNINDIDLESMIFEDETSKKDLNNNDNFIFINWIKDNYILSNLHYFLRERSVFYMWIKGIFTKTQERFYSHVYNLYKNKNYISELNHQIENLKKNVQVYNSDFTVIILPYEFQVRKNNCNENYLFPQDILKKVLLLNSIKFYDYTNEFCNQKNASNFFLKFDPVHLSYIGHNFVFKLLKNDLSFH